MVENARVFYHVDIPGQALLHVHGEKKIWLYPNEERFLKQKEFEEVVTNTTAEEISYHAELDKEAQAFELKSGQGLFWPLNLPHRVENGNSVNVSLAIEFHTKETRKNFHVNYANGMMSAMFGYRPRSQSIEGASFWTKAAMSYALDKSGIGSRIAQNATKKLDRNASAKALR